MGFAGFGRPVDHALGSGLREPARVGRVGFRHEFRLGGLCASRGLENRLGKRFVLTPHRRQVLIDRPLDSFEVRDSLERGPLTRNRPLVDRERTASGNDVHRRPALYLGDGEPPVERLARDVDGRKLEVPNAVDGRGGAVDGVVAGISLAGVCGGAVGGDRAPAPALVGDGDVGDGRARVVRRSLADDGVVGCEPLVDRMLCTDAADLLADETRDDEFPRGVSITEGEQGCCNCAFHVRRPAAVEATVSLVDGVLAGSVPVRARDL